jgi:hypothetical protein
MRVGDSERRASPRVGDRSGKVYFLFNTHLLSSIQGERLLLFFNVGEPAGARDSQLENFTACCRGSFYPLAPR